MKLRRGLIARSFVVVILVPSIRKPMQQRPEKVPGLGLTLSENPVSNYGKRIV
jgi:hypothetical protein